MGDGIFCINHWTIIFLSHFEKWEIFLKNSRFFLPMFSMIPINYIFINMWPCLANKPGNYIDKIGAYNFVNGSIEVTLEILLKVKLNFCFLLYLFSLFHNGTIEAKTLSRCTLLLSRNEGKLWESDSKSQAMKDNIQHLVPLEWWYCLSLSWFYLGR